MTLVFRTKRCLRQSRDIYTVDLFAEQRSETAEPFSLREVIARIAVHLDADRREWWGHPDRAPMRKDQQWNVIYRHLCAAALRTHAVAEDVSRYAAGGFSHRTAAAPLGIYGENAVTFDEEASQ